MTIFCHLIQAFLFIVVPLFLIRMILFKTGYIYIVMKHRRLIEDWFHVYQFFKVPEFNENLQENLFFRKVVAYLNSLTSIEDSDFTNLFSDKKLNEVVLQLDQNQIVEDGFLGARVYWISGEDEAGNRNLVLKIRKSDKRRILRPYLQQIHRVSEELEQGNRELNLYMNITTGGDYDNRRYGRWRTVPFSHPCTFDTLAMETDLKNKVKSDLESFLKAKKYYKKLGRVRKRSFLLYGPSGTGKSSFVAAMANFLQYDVYDVDLSNVSDDADLKMLILQTKNRSLIVIEDLDRFLIDDLKSKTITLSGILNFMDGILTSCVADERVIVFTMNGKERVDPSVLRPGRIDVYIHFPFCDFTAFKTLANNYLGVKEHKQFIQVEEMFQTGASLSPAAIGELMIANRNSPSRALKSVISALQTDGDVKGRDGVGRRLMHGDGSRRSSAATDEPNGPSRSGGASPGVEFRKLYGLLRIKSNRKSNASDLSREPRDG